MLRSSPLYTRQEVAGAVFGETMAYERAMYFNLEDGKPAIYQLYKIWIEAVLFMPSTNIEFTAHIYGLFKACWRFYFWKKIFWIYLTLQNEALRSL